MVRRPRAGWDGARRHGSGCARRPARKSVGLPAPDGRARGGRAVPRTKRRTPPRYRPASSPLRICGRRPPARACLRVAGRDLPVLERLPASAAATRRNSCPPSTTGNGLASASTLDIAREERSAPSRSSKASTSEVARRQDAHRHQDVGHRRGAVRAGFGPFSQARKSQAAFCSASPAPWH